MSNVINNIKFTPIDSGCGSSAPSAFVSFTLNDYFELGGFIIMQFQPGTDPIHYDLAYPSDKLRGRKIYITQCRDPKTHNKLKQEIVLAYTLFLASNPPLR